VPALLARAAARFRARRAAGEPAAVDLAARLERFRAGEEWLARDALYEVLSRRHRGACWREWPDPRDRAPPVAAGDRRRRALLAARAGELEEYALVQLLLADAHAAFRARARSLGLALFADLQVGMSDRDAWAAQGFTLAGWRMGAPPSRTNPEGQPWGFPVLDPAASRGPGGDGGPALAFVRTRARKAFAEYDGLRIDHPHGLVCPWVYRVGDGAPPPALAVRGGARLFGSPDVPALAAFAIARADQLDRTLPRHADGWVRALDDEQVARYAVLLDAVVAAAPDPRDVACEVLSTQPYPLARVLARHRLGRFRITQKADLSSPADVYRSDRAQPEDWIMLGNHDTRPIRAVAEGWAVTDAGRRSAEYLAGRLLPRASAGEREAFVARTAGDPLRLAQAAFADLFVGPARHVHVYFTDLLGLRERYNAPGVVSDENWSLRLAPGVQRRHAEDARAGRALDVARALAAALRARDPALAPLAARLDAAAGDAR
jgi:4-alpha-glucanotransferase